jgi:uncharacterized membrane protein YkvA (DUF1232 family)
MPPKAFREVVILVPEDDHGAAKAVPGGAWTAPGATAGADDPFPTERWGRLVRRLPRYLKLAWGLAGEPRLPAVKKAGVLAAAAYLASPIDLVPGIVPVLGQLDDVAVVMLAIRAALRALDEPTRMRLLASAGLAPTDLDDDLTTIGLSARWLARRGARLGRRLLVLSARAAVVAGRAGIRVGGDVGRRVAPRVGAGIGAGVSLTRRGVASGASATGRRIGGIIRRRAEPTDGPPGIAGAPAERGEPTS